MSPSVQPRLLAIDALRGIVILLMILDHTRIFYFGFTIDPSDLTHTSPLLFLTRWITHFCAPVFVLLAGTSAYFYGKKHSLKRLNHYLVSRGACLIVFELTIIRFGWLVDFSYANTNLQVIWVLGVSMLALALLTQMPIKLLFTFGLITICGHNLLDGISADSLGSHAWLWHLLHEPGTIKLVDGVTLTVIYPIIPWIGIMAIGFCLGKFIDSKGQANPAIFFVGLSMCVGFVVLRIINSYGDPGPWSTQDSMLFSLFSFLNTTKYPPSLAFSLMTLGPALMLLYGLEKFALKSKLVRLLRVFGQVPMFAYITHLYIVHFSGIALSYLVWGDAFIKHFGIPGVSLGTTYLAWLLCCSLLYYPCLRYYAYKSRHDNFISRYI